MKRAVAGLLLAVLTVLAVSTPGEAATPNRAECRRIVATIKAIPRVPDYVAERFGQIAWRESGCVAQHVADSDDLSYSRFGLNFKGGNWRYWRNVCGVTNYTHTKHYYTDIWCAVAAYWRSGWAPWS